MIAHLGHPWIDDALVVARKHEHVYAEISALHARPWQLYAGLTCASEYHVIDKLLFGTDWSYATFEQTVMGLRSINRIAEGSSMPHVATEDIERIIARPTLDLLRLTATENQPQEPK